MRNIKVLVLFLHIIFFCHAQTIVAQGLEDDLEEQQLFADTELTPSGRKGALPPAVDLKPYCPPIYHQGYIPSCVGAACSYAQTIQYAVHNNWTDTEMIGESFFSPLFLYNKNRKVAGCQGFASLGKTLRFLTTMGNLKYKDFEEGFEEQETCQQKVTEELLQQASQYKIEHHKAVFAHNTTDRNKINRMKISLADSLAVIVGLDNFVFDEESDGKGKHALTFVGYNDDSEEFTYINSYGEDWGEKGFGKISYNKFLEDVMYAYQIHIKKEGKKPMTLRGNFHLTFEQPQSYKMPKASVKFQKDHYVLLKAKEVYKKGWQVNQGFQLLAQNNLADKHLYAFSLNPQNQAKIHFPLKNTSHQNSELKPYLTIPNEENVFFPEYVGSDYLCILLSTQKLDNFKAIIQEVQSAGGTIHERLDQVFGEALIPQSDILYNANNMEISAKLSNPKAFVAPIILEINVQ